MRWIDSGTSSQQSTLDASLLRHEWLATRTKTRSEPILTSSPHPVLRSPSPVAYGRLGALAGVAVRACSNSLKSPSGRWKGVRERGQGTISDFWNQQFPSPRIRPGSPQLRWAFFEAGSDKTRRRLPVSTIRKSFPDPVPYGRLGALAGVAVRACSNLLKSPSGRWMRCTEPSAKL